ncbi:MAG: YfcE family phosphodiesterase [Clostridia bacterium]|nr:YfcE family phosphodiesterase [Clostridia bacterium]
MFRLLVVSDTHGDRRALQAAIDAQPEATLLVHLGDGAADLTAISEFITVRTLQVAGNCDFSSPHPDDAEFKFGGQIFFAAHGHHYGVKHDLYRFSCAARSRGARVALFGHTHQALTLYDDGLYLINPGSLDRGGTYATVDVASSGGIVANIVKLRY